MLKYPLENKNRRIRTDHLVQGHASAASVDIQVTSGATTVYFAKAVPIPVGSSLVAVGGDQKLVLEAADVLKVTSTVTVDVTVSVLEIS